MFYGHIISNIQAKNEAKRGKQKFLVFALTVFAKLG